MHGADVVRGRVSGLGWAETVMGERDELAKAERWIQQCVRAVPMSYPQLLIDELARLRLELASAKRYIEEEGRCPMGDRYCSGLGGL